MARLKQGAHIDPLDPTVKRPDPSEWSPRRRSAFESRTMKLYKDALSFHGQPDVRASVLDDLSSFYGYSPEECVDRCIEWEAQSVREWSHKDRGDRKSLTEFYQENESWSFDLLWYAYLQAEGYSYPVSVAIAEAMPSTPPGKKRRHLDFGSGIGATAQLFNRLGYESDMADISTALLKFAKFRLARRGDKVRPIDLNTESLPTGEYDVITAIDTLVHVPDVPAAVLDLHRALKPGGLLFANFDTRPPSPENAWHLYADDLPLRFQLQRSGFEPADKLDGFITCYRSVSPHGLKHALRGGRDLVLLKSPLRYVYRKSKEVLRGETSVTEAVSGGLREFLHRPH